MKLTWYGHSAFGVELGDSKILIDPFVEGVPWWQGGWKEAAKDGCTHVLLTHGHNDHVGSAVDICNETGAMLVANFEVCTYLVAQGVPENKINPGNPGGTVDCGGFTTSFVRADHSSSFSSEAAKNVYMGVACGLILKADGEKTLYHMGDTDIFSDMALINEIHSPQIGIVPIGDRFTMGAKSAALACNRYFDFETIVPCHFASFPPLAQTADGFLQELGSIADRAKVLAPGETIEL